jgi:hypothetical protein
MDEPVLGRRKEMLDGLNPDTVDGSEVLLIPDRHQQ